ncbi:hypothetical protein GTQ40_00905 [Flavobacteriaceae bacterium R38]|nr:hypothetical protein [Flavobacteriaceae bacterium R38]
MKQLFLIILCFPLTLFAQDESVILNGKITNEAANLEGIHILNLTSLVATITKKDGTFQINGKVNDTVLISAIQYKTQKIILNTDQIQTKTLNVELIPNITELDEVVVRPHNLTGNLSRDLKENPSIYEKISPSKLGLPNAYVKPKTQTERRLFEAKSGGGILPLNPIINAITGRTKKLKNQLKLERKEKKLEATKEQFNTALYSEFLKIPEDRIDDFIYYCAVDNAFIAVQQTEDTFLMLELLRKKSIEYRKVNNLN